MSIHDFTLDNQNGLNFRADLNNAIAAIVSNSSNPTEPTTTNAYMWWADTTSSILKMRNASNTDWVEILNLTTGGSVATGIDDLVDAIADGLDNLALGSVLPNNTTGFDIIILGIGSMDLNTTGFKIIAIGNGVLPVNTLGSEIIAIGNGALPAHTTGFRNIALGYNAAHNITTENHTISLGHDVQSLGSFYFTFGESSVSNRVYNNFAANATWTRASDKRIKKDIETNEDCGLGFINDLSTVTYKFKAPSELDQKMSEYDKDNDKPSHDKKMYGFIAQEVKQVLDNNHITDFAGWHIDEKGKDKLQGISYEMFVVPLVKAVQQLSAINDKLYNKITAVELELADTNKTVEALTLRLDALEGK